MKQSTIKHSNNLLHKVVTIEEEMLDLKLDLLKNYAPSGQNLTSLKGILKGVEISTKDIEEAKKSLYSKVGI